MQAGQKFTLQTDNLSDKQETFQRTDGRCNDE